MLEGFTLFTDWLVVEERQRGLTSLRQINRKTREVVGIAFDNPAYVTWLAYNPEPETSRLRYGYSSMTTPDTLFELDMDTGERRADQTAGGKGAGYELLPERTPVGDRPRWRRSPGLSGLPSRTFSQREQPAAGLWLWLIWREYRCRFQRQPAEPARTAALSTPSPTSAAAASWVSNGMKTVNSCVRKIPSTTIWTSVTRCLPRGTAIRGSATAWGAAPAEC